jgi:hypothetical protein
LAGFQGVCYQFSKQGHQAKERK